MPTPLDHLLAIVLVILFPIRARARMRGKLARAAEAELPAARLGTYRGAIAVQWTLVAAAAALWIASGRPWRELGVVPVLNGGLVGILVGMAAVTVVAMRQLSRGGPDERTAESLRRRTVKIERMMPRSPRDLRWFSALAVTAGICEEVLYRGYMIWYLTALGLPLIPAAIASAVIFGLGHLYQGLVGMLQTGVVGAFLAAVYLLSGSLLAGILIHALMDLYSGRMLYAAYATPPAPDPGARA